MADAPDSKSGRGNPVRVQVPPPAPIKSASYSVRLTFHPRVDFQLVRTLSVSLANRFPDWSNDGGYRLRILRNDRL